MSHTELNIDPAKLRPYAYNAKEHTEEQVSDIAVSLSDFGQVQPVVVDENLEIIIGHGRVLAAQKLGLKTITVWQRSDYSEAQKRALRLADNKLNMDTGFDIDKLAPELEKVSTSGYDVSRFSFPDFFQPPKAEAERGADVDTTREKLEAYQNNPVKQVVLYFDAVLFEDVVARMNNLRLALGVADNSALLLWLLAKHGVKI